MYEYNADYKGTACEHIKDLRMTCRYINELEYVGTVQLFGTLVYYSLVVSKTMRLTRTVQTLPQLTQFKVMQFQTYSF